MAYQVWLMKDGVPVAAGPAMRDLRTVMVPDIGRAIPTWHLTLIF